MRFLLFLLPLSLVWAAEPDLNDLSAGNALGGPEVLDIVKNAQTVTAQRIDSELAESPEKAVDHPKILILGQPFAVSKEEAAELKHVFSQSSTFLSPSKTCAFRANVRYGFEAPPDRKVEMILCFGCCELEVWQKDKFVSFGPFDGGYAEILAITKRLFPQDDFLARFDPGVFQERAARMREFLPGTPK